MRVRQVMFGAVLLLLAWLYFPLLRDDPLLSRASELLRRALRAPDRFGAERGLVERQAREVCRLAGEADCR